MDPLPSRLIVDGLNLLGSRPDGWWRDRTRAMRELVGRLDALARHEGIGVEVVFDGCERSRVLEAATERVDVSFAPGGPDAADHEIAARVRAAEAPGEIMVVSSDRRLIAAVKAAGGRRCGSGEFARSRLPEG